MNAYVKMKGIDNVCKVPNVKKIISMHDTNGKSTETSDFEALRFYPNMYYVFVGDHILHVWGYNIEFVSFQ